MKTASDKIALRGLMLAFMLVGTCVPGWAATTAPKASARPAMPKPPIPTVPLHTEFIVEVNAKGQVVRVKSAKGCKDVIFNAQTYGNVLQMWIRHPDGTAEVGLYRVSFDFDPKTKKVHRAVAIVSEGGSWGNEEGAATQMMDTAEREAREAEKQRSTQHEQQSKNLPPLNAIVGKPSPSASP